MIWKYCTTYKGFKIGIMIIESLVNTSVLKVNEE